MENGTNDEFLTFTLGEVAYAVNVCSVREVLTYEPITRVPRTVPYLKGVLNIRGTVIPVIDFRILFNIEPSVDEPESSIIVSEVHLPDEQEMVFGFLADTVENVIHLQAVNESENQLSALKMLNNNFIKTVGRTDNRFVLVLDMEKIIAHMEVQLDKQR